LLQQVLAAKDDAGEEERIPGEGIQDQQRALIAILI